MAPSIAYFVSAEVGAIDTLGRLRFFTRFRHRTLVAVFGVEIVVHVALEVGGAMKPWASANKDGTGKPFWTVIASGSAGIRSDVIVTIGTLGGYADFYGHLSFCLRCKSR